MSESPRLDRRDFLRQSGAVALGTSALGLAGGAALGAPLPARIRRYAPLGKTGLEIADIGFGSSRTTDPDVVRHAFELGVNYFDTAEDYQSGESERAEVFSEPERRTGCQSALTADDLVHALKRNMYRIG